MTKFIDDFSKSVWETTYKYHEDATIDDTLRRVAKAIASVEKTEELKSEWEEKFYDLLSDFKGTCGGRIYSNAGTDFNGTTLANCFVGPNNHYDIDSLESILERLTWQAKTLKSEGGFGENFSYIRPRGSYIKGIGVESPGAVKFMEMFDKSSEIVTSGSGLASKNKKVKGKIRKGAQMGVLDDWHPDVIEFITAKQSHGRLTKFNMSVNFSDEFMEKLNKLNEDLTDEEREEVEKWELIFPDTSFDKYKEEWDGDIKSWKQKGYPVVIYSTTTVSAIWNLVMESTYNRAEPGVLFLDRANHFNPANYQETIKATNP